MIYHKICNRSEDVGQVPTQYAAVLAHYAVILYMTLTCDVLSKKLSYLLLTSALGKRSCQFWFFYAFRY